MDGAWLGEFEEYLHARYADTSIKRFFSALKALMNYACQNGLLDANPFDRFRLSRRLDVRTAKRALATDELDSLIRYYLDTYYYKTRKRPDPRTMKRRCWRVPSCGCRGEERQASYDAEQFALSMFICSYIFQGLALVDLAIGVAMVLMFLVSIKEQNEEMLRLETSRAHLAEKLDIATVLNRCVEKLSGGGHDLDKATHDLLGVINDYFCADRSYVYELNAANGIAVNTHEFVRDGVSAEKDNLQKVPVEIIASWLEAFERDGIYFMEDVGQVKGTELYAMMQQQNVQRLLAVPLRRETRIIGFLGVDNPREHSHDPTLLSSIQFFVTNSLEQKKVQEKLYRLSYRDTLTGLDNRNRYMELLEAGKENALKQVGGIYMDLNGLKRCNDCFGHAAGDALICRAADALNDVFPGEACRIGGDEFVVICCPVTQEKFEQQVEALRAALVRHQVDAAIGSFWQSLVKDLPAFLREADDRMYREKERQKRAARPSV